MRIEYEGESYDFDLDDLTVKQALKIEKHIGGPMMDFEKGMITGSAVCYQAMGWLIFHHGDSTPIADVDFKFGKLAKGFEAAMAAEREAQAAGPDPTAAAAASNGQTSAPVSSLSG